MVKEIQVRAEDRSIAVFVSDEPEALLAAKAAGRAIVGVEPMPPEDGEMYSHGVIYAPYIVPGWEYVTGELAELAARRFLGLPWMIGETERLVIRELRAEDRDMIPPEEELSAGEELFRDEEKLRTYIQAQYSFYEYGTWAVLRREDGRLVGLAGVSQPRLPRELEVCLDEAGRVCGLPCLELGYHIFSPYRRRGYAAEACREILEYTGEVLACRVCALIAKDNKASRGVAESLGLVLLPGCGKIRETDNGSSGRLLLYVQNCPERPDRQALW